MMKTMSNVGVVVVASIVPKFSPALLTILTVFIFTLLTKPGLVTEKVAPKSYYWMVVMWLRI